MAPNLPHSPRATSLKLGIIFSMLSKSSNFIILTPCGISTLLICIPLLQLLHQIGKYPIRVAGSPTYINSTLF